ncbi:condensin, putative [Ixodes scapularis]|uniref:Condensin, putative n=1 Tax=Ixodes scapularis TaxID=6945 RepID=B7Q1S8_IXOSC|nr:condensin, putative [Ixodes scapularis]|eukprot:XP_002410088.1 condensin, putative [Ixodes scapularis]
MSDFVFVLPLVKDDLRRAENIGQYFVKDVLTTSEIASKVREHLSKKKSVGECDIIDSFDLLYSSLVSSALSSQGRKKAAPKSAKFVEWSSEKVKALGCLQNLFELHLQRLWSPQPVEEEFINLVADCCFKLVEDPSSAKTAGVREAVTAILGLNVKKHSYGLACVVKIIQLLQTCEHAAVFFADAMLTFVRKFGVTHIVGDTIRELCRLDSLESAQESGSIRNMATFLVELSERMPDLVLKSASLLDSLLDIKSCTIRNSVLTVFSKAVLAVLSRDDLAPGKKELRDLLLDKLEAHLEDENAFVRSHVLQLWQELCVRGMIPLGRQHALAATVAGRLLDRSSMVRRHAVCFLATSLDCNPFSAKDCVHFAKQMKTIVPTLCDLLRSPTVSDVQETIAFFVSAHRFGVEDASVGLREMLPLMWSAEAGVREAVVSSYREVYFDAKSGGNSRRVCSRRPGGRGT